MREESLEDIGDGDDDESYNQRIESSRNNNPHIDESDELVMQRFQGHCNAKKGFELSRIDRDGEELDEIEEVKDIVGNMS